MTTHFSFRSDTEEVGSSLEGVGTWRIDVGGCASSSLVALVALTVQRWSEKKKKKKKKKKTNDSFTVNVSSSSPESKCVNCREYWWVLSMKAISSSPSSSSPPPPSSSSSSSHSAAFLRSSCSCSSLSGAHALSACFNRRRLNGDENRIKLVVLMAKKKKPSSPSSSSPQASESTPARITSNVKQNLQFLKLWKEFQKRNSGIPKPATSYRRKKLPKEDLPDDDMELYGDPTLALYHTNQGIENAVPVLLVDGYNVCGYWAKLKKHFVSGRLDIARQKLIDELVSFSMLREVKVVVVFDAMMSGLPTHKEIFNSVDIIYSGESCADAWIEKEVVALKEDGCPRVWVATSDRCQQQAAHGAGAFVWSCKALVSEIKASQKEVERMLQEQRTSSFQGKLLKHNLDSEVVDALKDLRKQLSETELRNS